MNDFLPCVIFCCQNKPFPAETAVVFQNRLILVETDIRKIKISIWKHIFLICIKYLKVYLMLL